MNISNDWSTRVNEDLKVLGMNEYTIENIGKLKKNKLKQLIKDACKKVAFQQLTSEIENKNMTKLKNIKYKKLEMQGYLKSQKIKLKMKKILFKARTRMLNVKDNFWK